MPFKGPHKRYPLDQSPLFRLRGKGQFEKVLGVAWDAVPELLSREGYRVWVNEKGREIQAPIHWMAHIHSRIGALLARIVLPDYLYSQKGRSYADNARQHVGNHPVVKTDIHRFYPSTSRAMVVRMFVDDFQCAEDVAHRLADICCYEQKHLPTGSPLSGRIAFFAARHLFDQIADMATCVDCKLTIYVDDITLSGNGATKRLLGKVRKLVCYHGLKTKQGKSKTFAAGAAKLVTGAVIVGGNIFLPNKRHRKLWQARVDLRTVQGTERKRLQRVVRGRIQEAQQILRCDAGVC